MTFGAILREIVENCGGGIGAALMGNDGIPIEEVAGPAASRDLPAGDIATAGVEFGRILEEIRKASDAVAGGSVSETVIRLSRFSLVFHPVDEDIFLVVALHPDGNLGKARYLIRRNLLALRQLL